MFLATDGNLPDYYTSATIRENMHFINREPPQEENSNNKSTLKVQSVVTERGCLYYFCNAKHLRRYMNNFVQEMLEWAVKEINIDQQLCVYCACCGIRITTLGSCKEHLVCPERNFWESAYAIVYARKCMRDFNGSPTDSMWRYAEQEYLALDSLL